MLSPLAKQETLTIAVVGMLLSAAVLLLGAWWLLIVTIALTLALTALL